MLLSESLAWTLENYGCSGLKIYCDSTVAKEIANSFLQNLLSYGKML